MAQSLAATVASTAFRTHCCSCCRERMAAVTITEATWPRGQAQVASLDELRGTWSCTKVKAISGKREAVASREPAFFMVHSRSMHIAIILRLLFHFAASKAAYHFCHLKVSLLTEIGNTKYDLSLQTEQLLENWNLWRRFKVVPYVHVVFIVFSIHWQRLLFELLRKEHC